MSTSIYQYLERFHPYYFNSPIHSFIHSFVHSFFLLPLFILLHVILLFNLLLLCSFIHFSKHVFLLIPKNSPRPHEYTDPSSHRATLKAEPHATSTTLESPWRLIMNRSRYQKNAIQKNEGVKRGRKNVESKYEHK